MQLPNAYRVKLASIPCFLRPLFTIHDLWMISLEPFLEDLCSALTSRPFYPREAWMACIQLDGPHSMVSVNILHIHTLAHIVHMLMSAWKFPCDANDFSWPCGLMFANSFFFFFPMTAYVHLIKAICGSSTWKIFTHLCMDENNGCY